jgi:uncharacterized membrane protein
MRVHRNLFRKEKHGNPSLRQGRMSHKLFLGSKILGPGRKAFWLCQPLRLGEGWETMREIQVTVPRGAGEKVLEKAAEFQVENPTCYSARDVQKEVDVVILHAANESVDEIIRALSSIEGMRITLHPQDVFPLNPREKHISSNITSVSPRSPLEIWLNGLQSVGSWKGFLGYTVGASVIVWIALYTNTIYLLVAAMLVAPYAGPAMNLALATATGDSTLLRRNLIRYGISLSITIAITTIISLLIQQESSTATMVQISEVSSLSLLLPLTAGAVGALNLSLASNNSLVPGTAVGTLVAASLAPPAGLIGMSLAQGRWDMAANGAFLLLLQLFAINASGSLVFRAFGLGPESTHFQRGRGRVFYISLGASLAALAALLVWQFSSSPNLQRSTRAQRASGVVQQIVVAYPHADLVETNVRFPRPTVDHQDLLLSEVYVMRASSSELSAEQIRLELSGLIRRQLDTDFHGTPLVTVTVLDAP